MSTILNDFWSWRKVLHDQNKPFRHPADLMTDLFQGLGRNVNQYRTGEHHIYTGIFKRQLFRWSRMDVFFRKNSVITQPSAGTSIRLEHAIQRPSNVVRPGYSFQYSRPLQESIPAAQSLNAGKSWRTPKPVYAKDPGCRDCVLYRHFQRRLPNFGVVGFSQMITRSQCCLKDGLSETRRHRELVERTDSYSIVPAAL